MDSLLPYGPQHLAVKWLPWKHDPSQRLPKTVLQIHTLVVPLTRILVVAKMRPVLASLIWPFATLVFADFRTPWFDLRRCPCCVFRTLDGPYKIVNVSRFLWTALHLASVDRFC